MYTAGSNAGQQASHMSHEHLIIRKYVQHTIMHGCQLNTNDWGGFLLMSTTVLEGWARNLNWAFAAITPHHMYICVKRTNVLLPLVGTLLAWELWQGRILVLLS